MELPTPHLDDVPESIVDKAIDHIVPGLTDFVPAGLKKEKMESGIDVLLGTFSNIDISKAIQALVQETNDAPLIQWGSAEALAEMGKKHLKTVEEILEHKPVAESIKNIPKIALLVEELTHIHIDWENDLSVVRSKYKLIEVTKELTALGRFDQAIDIVAPIGVDSIRIETKKHMFESLVTEGDPVVAFHVIQAIDPELKFLLARGKVAFRLSEIGQHEKAAKLAIGRNEKDQIPSIYYSVPLPYFREGKLEKCLETAKKLFPEADLYTAFYEFALTDAVEREQLEEFEILLQKEPDPLIQNRMFISLYLYLQNEGLTGLATSYARKIDFHILYKNSPHKVSKQLFIRGMGKLNPLLGELCAKGLSGNNF